MALVRETALVAFAGMALWGCTCNGRLIKAVEGDLAARLEGGALSHDLAVDLGTVLPGQLVDRKLYFENQGGFALAVASLRVERGNSTVLGVSPDRENPFAIDLQAGVTLQPGVERETRVRFYAVPEQPTAPMEFSSDILFIATGDETGDVSVRLRLSAHVAPCPSLQPAQLDFGPTLVGAQSVRSLSVANPTSYELTVTAPASGLDATPFSCLTVLPLTLPPGGSAEISVVFEPTRASSFQADATLFVGNCTATSSILTGVGLDRVVDWSPEAIDCGWVPVGLTVSRSITLTNRGSAMARVTGAQVVPDGEGTVAGDFGLPHADWSSSFQLAPGESAVKSIICSPTGLGEKKGRLEIAFDVAGQAKAEIALAETGGGPELAVDPQAVDFGQVAYVAGAALYATRPVRIGNVGEQPPGQELAAALRLGTPQAQDDTFGPPYYRVEVESADTFPEEFSLDLPDDFASSWRIASGTWIDATVRITPKSPGSKRATLIILSNDLHQPTARIAVSAEALGMPPCSLRVLNPTLDFGIVHATSPRTFEVVIENLGTDANQRCLISNWSFEGAANGFSAESPLQATILEAGQKLRLPVRLAPQALPSYDPVLLTGALRANVSRPANPYLSVDLRGFLGQACLTLLPDQINFGTIPPGTQTAEISPQFLDLCGENVTLTQVALDAPEGGFELQLPTSIPANGLEILADDITRPWPVPDQPLPETHPFGIRFAPQTSGRFQGRVIVDLVRSGKQLRYVLPLAGAADATALTQVAFEQGGGDAVDVLLYVDSLGYTGSASEAVFRVEQLAAQVGTLLRVLERAGNDYHVGVTNAADDGASSYNPPPGDNDWDSTGLLFDQFFGKPGEIFLTPSTQNVAAELAYRISPGSPLDPIELESGESGSADLNIWEVLTPPYSLGPNLGFRRGNTRLSLLAVHGGRNWFMRYPGTQFPYAAPGDATYSGPPPRNPGELAKALMEFAGPPYLGRVSFADIGLMSDLPCQYQVRNSNKPGIHLDSYPAQAYAQLFGGSLGNLCQGNDSDLWHDFAELLGESASGMRLRFPLPTSPDFARGPVEVTVDGAVVPPIGPSGNEIWHYDALENTVRFGVETTPLPGSRISIRYYTLVP